MPEKVPLPPFMMSEEKDEQTIMTDLENRLTAALYRATCPDSAELGEYHLGLISGTRADSIDRHLAECPHCQRELTQLDSFLAQVQSDLTYSAAERIKIWIARRLPDLPSGERAPSPAFAIRGGDEESGPSQSLIFEAGDAQLMIDVGEDPSDASRRTIVGLVIGVDPLELEARLWFDGQLLTTAAVDELGNFTFVDLKPGHYELILAGPGSEIHVQELLT